MIDDIDIPEDLKGDLIPEIDPQKLFDENEYSTIIVGAEGMTKKDSHNVDYLTVLLSKASTREEKDEALINLKENKAQEFIIGAISKSKNLAQKARLVAVCWETGLDFSKDYLFFINLICDADFLVAFEAYTVISEMMVDTDEAVLDTALKILKKQSNPSVAVTDAILLIEQKLEN